jgi:ABC-type antimicrobial peptide transport system permease subunit
VRTSGAPDAVAAALPRAVAGLDPQVLVTTQSLERALAAELRPARVAGLAGTVVGALAAALAAVGVYGIVAYGVSQRRREIGIRLALGASGRAVVGDEVRRAARVVLPGLAAGVALAAGAAYGARALLYGVSPLDPLAFVGMTTFLAAVAAAAVLAPARRAARLDPAASLRAD